MESDLKKLSLQEQQRQFDAQLAQEKSKIVGEYKSRLAELESC